MQIILRMMNLKLIIMLISLDNSLTCTGSTGLVTGPAFIFFHVIVEAIITVPLAPVPLQTEEGGESMWHRDTLSQSCDATKDDSLPSCSQAHFSNPRLTTTSSHQTESVNSAF